LENRGVVEASEGEEGGAFQPHTLSPDDTQPMPAVDLGPMNSPVAEFVAPPELVEDSSLPDPFDDEAEVGEVLLPLAIAESALRELREETSELAARLDEQTQNLMVVNRRAVLSSALFMILVAIYMVWAGGQMKVAFKPGEVADMAAGVAKDAIPQAGAALHLMLEDGAVDIAEMFGNDLVKAVPKYREGLVLDLDPAFGALSELLVQRLFKELLETPTSDYGEAMDGLERTRALESMLNGLDLRLSKAIDEQSSIDRVAAILDMPTMANRALNTREEGRKMNHERDLLLMWLTVISGR
jgi:hypothetical protein